MDVDDHQDASTRSYGYDVVTPSAGGHVKDNRMVGKVVLAKKNGRPACIYVVQRELAETHLSHRFLGDE